MNVREAEYQAIRNLMRRVENPDPDGIVAKLGTALNEELTPRQKEMAELYYLRQMSMPDMSKRLGVCVSTVSRTLARARRRLQRCIKYGALRLLRDS